MEDGAWKVTRVVGKQNRVYGLRMGMRCVWTADASMQNAAYVPDEVRPDAEEELLGRIKTDKYGDMVAFAKGHRYLFPYAGEKLYTYFD